MPVDPVKTQRFVHDPDAFTDKNFVQIRGQAGLAATSVWQAVGGGAVEDRHYGAMAGSIALAATHVKRKDCLRIVSIGGRTRPICYVGLEAGNAIFVPDASFYEARVSALFVPGYQRVLFLPARANQITFIHLPTAGGPDVVMTDALTGCTICVGTIGGTQVLSHANAYVLPANESQQYMRALITKLVESTGMTIAASLTKGKYVVDRATLGQSARQAKIDLGRATVNAQVHDATTVFGVRANGVWSIHYMNHAVVDSTRTGAAAFFKGASSHKARVSKHVLL